MINEIRIKKYVKNEVSEQEDLVIKEHWTNIIVNGEHYTSMMCLPQDLDELTVGLLFSEGVIASYTDVQKIDSACLGSIFVDIGQTTDNAKPAKRAVVLGAGQINVNLPFFNCDSSVPLITGTIKISSDEVIRMMGFFENQSELFLKTGAVHSCALVLPDGKSLFYEDISRHNAVDKVIGKALMSGLCLENGILLTSGRISSEILIKAAKLGISIIISISAPTNMAVEIARKINMTLIGFARGNRFNVYAGDDRVAWA